MTRRKDDFERYLEEQLKNPVFREEYEKLKKTSAKELFGVFHKYAKGKPPLTEEAIGKATEEELVKEYKRKK